MDSYYDGLNIKLLNAIPNNAVKVLELGCANGKLGRRYKEINKRTCWVGVDINKKAISEASKYLDEVHEINIDTSELEGIGNEFDVIVIGDLLEHLKNPENLLDKIYDISLPSAVIVCCIPNSAHISIVERLISGDFSYDEMGLLDKTHTRLFSASSAIKTFLNSGWLPNMVDRYDTAPRVDDFTESIIGSAKNLGIPRATAIDQINLYQMIMKCEKWPLTIFESPGPSEPFSIIVPINRPWQYELNILRSPGLKEVNAEIIPVLNANSAAEAYQIGVGKAKNPWKIFVHQDVYFPTGTGLAIGRHLGKLTAQKYTQYPVGFAGMTTNTDGTVEKSGLLIDRKYLFKYGTANHACSIDEFAVAVHNDAHVAIDPQMGWHLWGTDLCLQSKNELNQYQTKIIDVPLFHNSTNDFILPSDFHKSVSEIFTKYSNLNSIETLCGKFNRFN
jgi:ubiquinone/menaquinone biosynthesis C-methylase UbiE